MYDYDLLEEKLARLLNSLQGMFSENEIGEVRQFLDAGEYGLSLETVCGIIAEEQKKVGGIVIDQIRELHELMQFDSEIVTSFLNLERSNNWEEKGAS